MPARARVRLRHPLPRRRDIGCWDPITMTAVWQLAPGTAVSTPANLDSLANVAPPPPPLIGGRLAGIPVVHPPPCCGPASWLLIAATVRRRHRCESAALRVRRGLHLLPANESQPERWRWLFRPGAALTAICALTRASRRCRRGGGWSTLPLLPTGLGCRRCPRRRMILLGTTPPRPTPHCSW